MRLHAPLKQAYLLLCALLLGTAVPGAASNLVERLIYSENNLELLLTRRALRLQEIPPVKPPPTDLHPIDAFIGGAFNRSEDSVFVRRVYLDVIGAIPTIAEARRFAQSTSPGKRTELIDELLARKEDYAAHWVAWWEDALGSSNKKTTGGIASRGNHHDWLFAHFVANTPYDVMLAQLLDPTMPGYKQPEQDLINGTKLRIGYVRNATHNETIQTAAEMGQVFFGTRMKCASCHSHFENPEWPQTRFLAFAGLFAANDLEVVRCERSTGKSVAAKFPFEIPDAPNSAPARVEDRLHRLVLLTTDPANPRFAPAIVNRLWKRYLGLGLVEPADDFRDDRPASHPELLRWLADDFMRHGFDLKHTIRLILTSETYQQRYDAQLEDNFDIAQPARPRSFRSPALRRLTAEQLLDSLRVASWQQLDPKARLNRKNESTALTRALGKPAARGEISTSRPDDVGVIQSLELLNGHEFHNHLYSAPLLERLASASATDLVDTLFWATLSRSPTEPERVAALNFLGPSSGHEEPEEICWMDDELPEGARALPSNAWRWFGASEGPIRSGTRAHTTPCPTNNHASHYFNRAKPLAVRWGDRLFVDVFIDPQQPPRQIVVQFYDDGWTHGASWGEQLIPRTDKGVKSMGALPQSGQWVRLELLPSELSFKSSATSITGLSFDHFGGVVYWDKAGILRPKKVRSREAVGDLFWANCVMPEFHYIR